MLEFSWFLCGVLSSIVYCYLFSNLVCREKFKINWKILLISIIFSIVSIIVKEIDSFSFTKPFVTHLFITLVLAFLYKKGIVKTIIGVLLIYIMLCVSELVYGFILMIIFKGETIELMKNPLIYLVSNIVIFYGGLKISNSKFIKKIIYNIVRWYDNNHFLSTIIFVLFAMTIATFLMYNNFANLLPNSILWFANLFCIGVMVFVIGFFKEKSNNNRIISEYDQLLDYVKKYEKVIDEKSKNQHEYKNQLILIKGMINKTNKKAIQYIDDLYKNEKEEEDLELLKKLHHLPEGGLKGLIYYKVEEMINKKIDVYVDISSDIKNIRSKKQLNNKLHDISKILGVYIDNAIEATMTSKQKYIIVEAYLENGSVVFSISNTYSGNVALNKLDKEGYTTKGEGKGYGLSLVKDIINRSDCLKQERSLNGMYYVQKLYIKK